MDSLRGMSIQEIKTRLRERIEASHDLALLEALLASLEAGAATADEDGLTEAQWQEAKARYAAHRRHPDESTSVDWETLRDESPD
jgi:hypothetical protein